MESANYKADCNTSRIGESFVKQESIDPEENNKDQQLPRHIKEENAATVEGFRQLEDGETRTTKRSKYDITDLVGFPNQEFPRQPQDFSTDGQQNITHIHGFRRSFSEDFVKNRKNDTDMNNGSEDDKRRSEQTAANYVIEEAEGFSSRVENTIYESKFSSEEKHLHHEYSESHSESDYSRVTPKLSGADIEAYWKQEPKDINNVVHPVMRTNPLCTDSVMTNPGQPAFYQIHDMDRQPRIQYECNLCGKNFSQNYDFTNHVYTHMDNMLCKILNAYR